MARRMILFLSLALFAASSFGQSVNRPRPDGFQGLILNETTSKDAIGSLGQPVSDKLDQLDVPKIGKWLDPKHKEKIFRRLAFKNAKDFRTIELSFLDDRLVMIELEFGKGLMAEKLPDLFGVEFALVGRPADLPDTPGLYLPSFPPILYPDFSTLIAISRPALILSVCRASFTGILTRVVKTWQISRTLEKK